MTTQLIQPTEKLAEPTENPTKLVPKLADATETNRKRELLFR